MQRKWMLSSVVGMAVLALAGCSAQGTAQNQEPVTVNGAAKTQPVVHLTQWTYYGPAQLAATQFEKLHPNIKITVKVFPGDQYETKLQQALSTGTDVPDIFDLDMGYIGKFINTPYVLDLKPLGGNKLVKDMVPYVAAAGEKSNGDVAAVTDTSSPGGFWYNRAAAKKWLGTDDPVKISQMVSTWPKLIALGEKVNRESKGKVHLLDFSGVVQAVEQYHMQPFIQNNKLVIDPRWTQILDIMRTINAKGVDAKLPTFSSGWGNALNDHSANPQAILFGVPSWAGFMIDAKTANGKYGVAKAPKGYYEGGRYAAIYAHSPNQQAAYEFLKFLASSRWQVWNLKNTANMPSLQSVFKQNWNTYRYPWFGNQNVLQMYYKIAMDIPAQKQDPYNNDIISMFGNAASTAIAQNKPDSWVIDQIKQQVRAAYPSVQVQ
ncbi:MAG: ABC transporter substrate-binding protein [Alicyclobacillus sp.]|nr:ABC transporter substrate-binding protein [Alicyclobacillus sp.]